MFNIVYHAEDGDFVRNLVIAQFLTVCEVKNRSQKVREFVVVDQILSPFLTA